MSRKKKILLGVGFVVFLVILWCVVYFSWLQVEPKGDNILTAEELKKYDEQNTNSVFTNATVIINDKEYELNEVKKSLLTDDVVVTVKVNDREVQGYITVSDTISSPEVRLPDSDNYAQVIIPEEEK